MSLPFISILKISERPINFNAAQEDPKKTHTTNSQQQQQKKGGRWCVGLCRILGPYFRLPGYSSIERAQSDTRGRDEASPTHPFFPFLFGTTHISKTSRQNSSSSNLDITPRTPRVILMVLSLASRSSQLPLISVGIWKNFQALEIGVYLIVS